MGDVVSLTQFTNDRRAAEIAARREKERGERDAAELAKAVAAVSFDPLASMLVTVAVGVAQEQRRQVNASRPMPAYCDPSNERRGSKFEATRGLSRVEIAKRMREDIKVETAAERLPKGLRVSVTTSSYSGGGSIDMRVTAFPPGIKLLSERYVQYVRDNPDDYRLNRAPFSYADTRSDEWAELLGKLKAIHGAYNRNNSDAMSDYSDVRYHGDVSVDWKMQREMRRAEGMPD